MIRYFELPGGGGGGALDYSLALLGDVRSAHIPVVEVDNTVFSLIGGTGVRVPTTAVMPDHLQAAPPGAHLGPFGADTPNTEVVRLRVTQVIPAKYAAALVHRDGIAPLVAFQELYGMLEADKVVNECADILAWLRAACTARGGAGDLAGLSAVAHSFPLMLMPVTVSDFMTSRVAVDLPRRASAGGGGPPVGGADAMAAAVQQLAANVGDLSDRGTREPRGVLEAYRETHTVLQRYCQVATVEELAPIWSRLARGAKGEQQSILQQELTRVCTARGLTPE
jgi:hypothetical protein